MLGRYDGQYKQLTISCKSCSYLYVYTTTISHRQLQICTWGVAFKYLYQYGKLKGARKCEYIGKAPPSDSWSNHLQYLSTVIHQTIDKRERKMTRSRQLTLFWPDVNKLIEDMYSGKSN